MLAHSLGFAYSSSTDKIIISIHCSTRHNVRWMPWNGTIQFLQMFCGFGNCKSNKPHQTNVHLLAYFSTRSSTDDRIRAETNDWMQKYVRIRKYNRIERLQLGAGWSIVMEKSESSKRRKRVRTRLTLVHWVNIKCAVTAPITRDMLKPRASNWHMKRVNSTNYLFSSTIPFPMCHEHEYKC